MTEQLEQELRQFFAEDAEQAPVSAMLCDGALRQVRQRRRAQMSWAMGAAAATVAAAAVVSGGLFGGQPTGDQLAIPPVAAKAPLPTPTGVARKGPLGGGGGVAMLCVDTYSPTRVTAREFAFDGTVVAFGPSRTNTPEWVAELAREGLEPDALVAATFTVHEWYRGGSGSTVTVDMGPPSSPENGRAFDESAISASYGLGTRLLVSGGMAYPQPKPPPPGRTHPKEKVFPPNAWGCGFTRYHDEATANSWRAAFEKAAHELRQGHRPD